VRDIEAQWLDENDLVFQFSLPSGCYATTVLRELIETQVDAGEEEASG
jgi:tRNA(Glu) U13 pseudouridine synthase TruD